MLFKPTSGNNTVADGLTSEKKIRSTERKREIRTDPKARNFKD